jgi:hypothetical protein
VQLDRTSVRAHVLAVFAVAASLGSMIDSRQMAWGAATIVPEFRIGTCGVGSGAPPCVWPCDVVAQGGYDLKCSCDDGSGAEFCEQGGACSTGTCPTCDLDAVDVFVGRLVIEVDDAACAFGQGGAKVTVALRGSKPDGSGQFTAATKVFDFCNVDVSCNESCQTGCTDQCDLGICASCDPQVCGQGSCPATASFLCELVDADEHCSVVPAGRRFCEEDLTVDTFQIVDWLRRGKQPIFKILGQELLEAGGVFEGYDGTAVIVGAVEDAVVDNVGVSEPSRGSYCIKGWWLREAKPTPMTNTVTGILENAQPCNSPGCTLTVADMGACNTLVPVCGDGVRDPGEDCDGASDLTCPGACQANCLCSAACPATPRAGCISGQKASLQVRRGADPSKDQLKWKLQKGGALDPADLGDPASTTSVSLCLYDETADVPSLIASIPVGAGAGWKSKAAKGFDFGDKTGAQHGVRKIQLRTGAAGKSKAQFSARGSSPSWPTAVSATQFFEADDSVVAQMIMSNKSTCWSTDLTTVKTNSSEKFNAKSP